MAIFVDGKEVPPLCMCGLINGERVISLMCPTHQEDRLENGHLRHRISEPLQAIGKSANTSDE